MRFPEEREIILTDTVGFIHNLPKTLIQAFKATLEELSEAHILLHVLDASDPEVENQMASVDVILADLDLEDRATLCVWNKADKAPPEAVDRLITVHGGVSVSALTGANFDRLGLVGIDPL